MLRTLRMLLALCVLALAQEALAQASPPASGTEAMIKRTLEERMPGIPIAGVVKTNFGGLYEVRSDENEIFYTDDKVTFVIVGTIRDGHNPQRNYTEERLQAITAVPFADLPFEDSFKIVRGTGKRKVAYFTDPNCPYCKQLERELLQLNDVTINVFLYPILSADSAPKARGVWCSNDRSKTWLDWMLNGVPPAEAPSSCNTQSVDKTLAFGHKIRVNSVPTLVFSNGTRWSGMRPAAMLTKMLDETAGVAAAADAGAR
jgi:thiol:disulfide interchange protein DsbC